MFETDAAGQQVVVEDLDPDRLLSVLADKEHASREAERGKLRLAVQWCVLHPATADTGVATWDDHQLPGVLDADESLGGEGTPAVAAFTPEPFAAALEVSTLSGMGLLADALDLVHRLPGIHARVEALAVPVWKARKVAQATHALSKEAAAYVDRAPRPRHRFLRRGPGRAGGGVGDREAPPRAPRPAGEAGQGRLARHPAPPVRHRVRRHLQPSTSSATPWT